MKIDLQNHHALVCGSSQGIGAGIATELAQAGAKVTAVARNENKLKSLMETLGGEGHRYLVADFSVRADVGRVCEYIAEQKVDLLINNTGGPAPGLIVDARVKDFEKALNMHLFTSHDLVQSALPYMTQQGYGRIVNVISTSVKIPINGLGVSNTTRHAMAAWAKTLANEVGNKGITVNNMLPGFIATDRLSGLISKLATDAGISEQEMVEEMKSTVPAGRFGLPNELGYLAVFLCSPLGGYINGASIPVDGGKTGTI